MSAPDVIPDLWYKNAVVYNLDVRTFSDSNGDGVGDFLGLTQRLDYLAGLGVTCLWLLPFYQSPDRDDGYDVSNYYAVDPKYGTFGDFVEFTHGAQQRGIRVIVDLVINHTSIDHPWFQEARRDPKSKYRNWYVWSSRRPRTWNKGMVFPGVQKSTWSFDKVARAWYFHRFYDFQPDLDTQNPEVQAEIRKIMGFWTELGVSGFRVDALPFVVSKKGPDVKPRSNFDQLRDMRAFLSYRDGEAVLLAEANVLPEADIEYFGTAGERVQMMFNFLVNQHVFLSLTDSDARPLAEALENTRELPDTAQWGHFLRNNDELDLGRLKPDERARVFAAFGPDEEMQLYDRGIRRRLSPMLKGDRRRLELVNSLMFTLPGTPVVRYGDEIGIGDDLSLPERQSCRTPMQWSTDKNAGFSEADKTILPVISEGPWSYRLINVAAQRREPESLLNWTERIIRMRKETPEIGWGKFTIVPSGARAVLTIRYDWRDTAVIVMHNLGADPSEVVLKLAEPLTNLLSHAHSKPDGRGRHTITLEPYGYRWFRVGGMTHVSRRRCY